VAVVGTFGMPPLISFTFRCELAKLGFFCNGPGFVKSSLHLRVIRSAGVVLLSGVGALAAT
jgi:hypothetical protein